MTIERAGALALIVGTVAMAGVMVLHPTAHGAASPEQATAMLRIGVIVHAIAIASAPLLTFGFVALTRSAGWQNPLAVLALTNYAFGAIAVMIAAAMSGLVAPKLMSWQMQSPSDQNMIHGLAHLEFYINQAFATIHAALFSIAIILWAVSWPARGALAAAVQIVGLVSGVGVLAWLFSGTLKLDVHGMGAVVLAQSVWILIAAIALWLRDARSD